MNYVLISVISALLLVGACSSEKKLELKDQKARESYSMGYRYGQSFKKGGVEVDLEVFTEAMREALAGKTPRMTSADMDAAIQGLRRKRSTARQQQLKEEFAENLAKSKAFLAENAKKAGVKTLPSGLQYRVLAEGSGKSPKPDDWVALRYRGTLIDGTEFDSTPTGDQPETFPVARVIPGWTEALQLMKEGAKWQLFVPPELGYGRRGMPRIPPYSALIFEIELVAVE